MGGKKRSLASMRSYQDRQRLKNDGSKLTFLSSYTKSQEQLHMERMDIMSGYSCCCFGGSISPSSPSQKFSVHVHFMPKIAVICAGYVVQAAGPTDININKQMKRVYDSNA